MNEKWRPEREAIHNHQVESINGMLRADQRPLYEAFRAERERQRKLHDQQHKRTVKALADSSQKQKAGRRGLPF